MNNTEKYQEVLAKLKEIDDLQNQVWKDREIWRENFYELVAAHIKESGILRKRTWQYHGSNGKSTFYLYCNHEKKEDDFNELYKVVEADYHCTKPIFWIDEAEWLSTQSPRWIEHYLKRPNRPERKAVVNLRFDDEELRIIGDSDEYMTRFVKEFGLNIDLSPMYKERDELMTRLRAVDKMIALKEQEFPQTCDQRRKP